MCCIPETARGRIQIPVDSEETSNGDSSTNHHSSPRQKTANVEENFARNGENSELGDVTTEEGFGAVWKRIVMISWKEINPFLSLTLLKSTDYLLFMSIGYFFTSFQGGTLSVWQLYTNEKFGWCVTENGALLVAYGVLSVIVQGFLLKPILKRFGSKKTLCGGLIIGMGQMASLGAATAGWMVYIILICGSFGSVGVPAMRGEITNEIPKPLQGSLQGAKGGISTLGRIFGSLLAGQVLSYFISEDAIIYLPGAPMYVSSFIGLFALVSVLIAFRHPSRSSFDINGDPINKSDTNQLILDQETQPLGMWDVKPVVIEGVVVNISENNEHEGIELSDVSSLRCGSDHDRYENFSEESPNLSGDDDVHVVSSGRRNNVGNGDDGRRNITADSGR